METKIALVIKTLNMIEVRGADNMNKLLGCIQELQGVLKEMSKSEKKPESGEKENGR